MWVDFSFSQGELPNFEDVLQAGRLVLLDADRDLLLTQLAKSLHDERSAATATARQNVNRPTRATQFDVDDDAEGTSCGKGALRANGVTGDPRVFETWMISGNREVAASALRLAGGALGLTLA